MPRSIPIQAINGNQFMKACTLMPPVVVIDARTFRIPSDSRAGREHTVTFDSAEGPTACSCTCEAAANGTACWAMARALDVLRLFSINQVYVWGRGHSPGVPAAFEPALPPLHASIGEGGELTLTVTAPPRRGEDAAVLAG